MSSALFSPWGGYISSLCFTYKKTEEIGNVQCLLQGCMVKFPKLWDLNWNTRFPIPKLQLKLLGWHHQLFSEKSCGDPRWGCRRSIRPTNDPWLSQKPRNAHPQRTHPMHTLPAHSHTMLGRWPQKSGTAHGIHSAQRPQWGDRGVANSLWLVV